MLRLPAELRNAIFAHACTHAKVKYWCSKQEPQTLYSPDSPGLRLACKQLYHEVPLNLRACTHLNYTGVPKYLLHDFWSTGEDLRADQIESIVVVRKPRAFRADDFRFVSDVLRVWPALCYLEIQGAFIWIGRERLVEACISMPHADLEVCFKYDGNASEWRFDCRARTLATTSSLPSAAG